MTHTPHELAEEFPDHASRIAGLKQTNPHFARLADDRYYVTATSSGATRTAAGSLVITASPRKRAIQIARRPPARSGQSTSKRRTIRLWLPWSRWPTRRLPYSW